MFIYKYCSKCKKRNHKTNGYCARCGDELPNDPKFGKDVFAVTLSLVILLSSATAFASRSYFNQRSENNSQPDVRTQNVESTQIQTETVADPEPIGEGVKSEALTKTRVKREVVAEPQDAPPATNTEPQISPSPAQSPVCDSSKRTALTNQYNADVGEARQKRDKLLDEANVEYASAGDRAREEYKDIWDPFEKNRLINEYIKFAEGVLNSSRDLANMDYNSTVVGLTAIYDADLKSIHCSN